MAERYAVATGNWSDVATWDGGTSLPGASDDVYANNFTVTIDQNVSVATIRSQAGATAAAGGKFTLSGSYDVSTTGGYYTGSTWLFEFSGGVGVSATITGDFQSQTGGSGFISFTGAGDLAWSGDQYAGSTNQNNINFSGTGTLTITGGPYDRGYNAAFLNVTGAGEVIINGDIDGAVAYAHPGHVALGTVHTGSNCVITINGYVAGSSLSRGIVSDGTSSADITVVGDLYPDSSYPAISQTGTGDPFCAVNGAVIGNGTQVAIDTVGTFVLRGGSIMETVGGLFPVDAAALLIDDTVELTMTFREDDSGLPGAARSLYTGGTDIGNPSAANVRSGTTFGPSNEYTGTLAIPSGQYVSLGVPVDSGVGTLAHLDASGIRSAIGLSSADLGTTLTNVQNNTNLIPGLF